MHKQSVRSGEGRTTSGRHSAAAIVVVKVVHTAAWFSIEACMIDVLWAGLAGRSDRRAAVAAAVVAGECVVFAANGFRCPLTDVARRLGADDVAVTDIYLPRWFAHYLPAIHVPLILASAWLHARNIGRRRAKVDGAHGCGG
jgi:hypothetical protein